ncbi:hypothetical protein [Bradyrhizobium genosp. A]|uniref:hypothetical protein n=1 Tax=Bradyrhizobium genosp. A TaxID=83626 RepID=UPI003CF75865
MRTKKYEFVEDDQIFYFGLRLRRIRALRDIPNVRIGDLGGYLQHDQNLSHEGNCWVSMGAAVLGNARVSEDARIWDQAMVGGYARVLGQARVVDQSRVHGYARILGEAAIYGCAVIRGYAVISGTTEIGGEARVSAQQPQRGWVHPRLVKPEFLLPTLK